MRDAEEGRLGELKAISKRGLKDLKEGVDLVRPVDLELIYGEKRMPDAPIAKGPHGGASRAKVAEKFDVQRSPELES